MPLIQYNGMDDLESLISELVSDVGSLFGRKTPPSPSGRQTTQEPQKQVIPSPGGYTAPIHGEWHNSGGFTYQPNPTHPKGHMGVDMRCPFGTPIYPLTAGVVTNVGTDPAGGNVVNIQHAKGVRTYYAHMSAARAQKGDKVDVNTIIGTVGETGNAKGTVPHCHFQVWVNGQIQDPAKFFDVPPYTNVHPNERIGQWVSEDAKQEAQAFNMQDHVARGRRVAFSKDVDALVKVAFMYQGLTKRASGL